VVTITYRFDEPEPSPWSEGPEFAITDRTGARVATLETRGAPAPAARRQ
jgi:hypothetical protein